MTRARVPQDLIELAGLHGVETAYWDVGGRRMEASRDALLHGLRALGVPLERAKDARSLLRERRRALWSRPLEPVLVAWEGIAEGWEVRAPAARLGGHARYRIETEGGEAFEGGLPLEGAPELRSEVVDGERYVALPLHVAERLPHGYHRLIVETPAGSSEALVISAPERAWAEEPPGRSWGVFLPLHALHSARSWGCGDLTDLGDLLEWVEGRGGAAVGTLPLLPTFLDEPFDPSPYAPVSRLFWNELYLDPARAPEMERCAEARAALESPDFRTEMNALRAAPLVDPRRAMVLKRRVLGELSRAFFARPGAREEPFQRFLAGHPEAEAYARFRAVCEERRESWHLWPTPLREGAIPDGAFDEDARRYHLYVQFLLQEQLAGLASRGGARLALDLPLGVHPSGFDVWREPELFARGASVGAPPDPFFAGGQDWGFPPPHPERSRESGHRQFLASLRNHLRHAGSLRLDHVMSLHRLYWIPRGVPAEEGVYVRYPAEELWAILTLESHRHRTLLVGEDLGTVPDEVREAMDRHEAHHIYVQQYSYAPDPAAAIHPAPARSSASLNTHDMFPFAAFWEGYDIEERLALGHMGKKAVRGERRAREAQKGALTDYLRKENLLEGEADARGALRGCLAHLAAGPARMVQVNLEDLWLEREPQNVPGTVEERPNWRRRARYSLEEIEALPEVSEALAEVDRLRRERC